MLKRGQIVILDLKGLNGVHIQKGKRPYVVVQNNTGNVFSPTIIVCPLTTKTKSTQPTHYTFTRRNGKVNTVLCEQIQTVGKSEVLERLEILDDATMSEISKCLYASIGR